MVVPVRLIGPAAASIVPLVRVSGPVPMAELVGPVPWALILSVPARSVVPPL